LPAGPWVSHGEMFLTFRPMRTTLVSLFTALAASAAFGSAALAGPSLTGINSTRIQGTAEFNTDYAESFSVTGTSTTAVTPFDATTGLTGMGAPTAPSAATNVGNVGTAVLAVTFLNAGDAIAGTATGPQVQSTSGIIQLGGSSTIGGSMVFNVPSSIILDQASVSAINIAAGGENIGASITGTQVGTSSLTADVTIVTQTINTLTAF